MILWKYKQVLADIGYKALVPNWSRLPRIQPEDAKKTQGLKNSNLYWIWYKNISCLPCWDRFIRSDKLASGLKFRCEQMKRASEGCAT
ncbi:MAG: hypothetical protein ACD_78C00274G0012 [uncultured bacterium (gcode 4)]|uniref:Uncharacterized protein n=1 Tax=uncultured bacterium (gcode 4) TaxID=1234023 RepID=K1XHI0_9BACT|nr:MAG: hypothetical protein ACD_78C00274G0012 [uncultured bacterium (gcode 4)]